MAFDGARSEIDEVLRRSQEQAAQARKVQDAVAQLVGIAESADGRIKVECTAQNPITNLHLDPQAMRLGSQQLAEAIMAVAGQARQDLERRTNEAATDISGGIDPLEIFKSREAMTQALTEVQDQMMKASKDAVALMEQFTKGVRK